MFIAGKSGGYSLYSLKTSKLNINQSQQQTADTAAEEQLYHLQITNIYANTQL